MGKNVVQVVGVALDREVKPPASIYPGLPDASGLLALLRAERRVAEVLEQEPQASVESRWMRGGALS